jgi:molybdenum cofactor cytidylyltransferase
VHRWATDNRRYRLDIDSPEDIEALARSSGHQLRWPAAFQHETTGA